MSNSWEPVYEFKECWNPDCEECCEDCQCLTCRRVAHDDAEYQETHPDYNIYSQYEEVDDNYYIIRNYCSQCNGEGKGKTEEYFKTPEFESAALFIQRRWRSLQYYYVRDCDIIECDCCDSKDAWIVIRQGEEAEDNNNNEIILCHRCSNLDSNSISYNGHKVFGF